MADENIEEVPETQETPETEEVQTPEKEEPKTAIESIDDTPVAAPTDWPEDWALKMAGGDEKKAKHLTRMGSPQSVYKALSDTQAKLTKLEQGADPDPFPEDGEEDEIKEWRERHKLPETPDGYIPDYDLGDGLVIGDEDKPAVDKFLEAMHARNENPETVKAAIKTYYDIQDMNIQNRHAQDEEDMAATKSTLRDEFGPEMNNQLSAAFGLIESWGEDIAGKIMNARLPDGKALGNDPDIIKALAASSLEINPAITTVPGSGGDQLASLQERKAEINKMMKEDRESYFGNDAIQKEYQQILEAEERFEKRAKR